MRWDVRESKMIAPEAMGRVEAVQSTELRCKVLVINVVLGQGTGSSSTCARYMSLLIKTDLGAGRGGSCL